MLIVTSCLAFLESIEKKKNTPATWDGELMSHIYFFLITEAWEATVKCDHFLTFWTEGQVIDQSVSQCLTWIWIFWESYKVAESDHVSEVRCRTLRYYIPNVSQETPMLWNHALNEKVFIPEIFQSPQISLSSFHHTPGKFE